MELLVFLYHSFFRNFYLQKKLYPLLVEKYDISQKVLKQLSNLEYRTVLFSIIESPLTVTEISNKNKIPLSSVYKIMQQLLESSLIVKKYSISDNGRITAWYQSRIKDVHISISKFEPTMSLSRNMLLKHE